MSAPAPQTTHTTVTPWRSLAVASLVVVAAHAFVLQNAPLAMAALQRQNAPELPSAKVFSTRMIAQPPTTLSTKPPTPARQDAKRPQQTRPRSIPQALPTTPATGEEVAAQIPPLSTSLLPPPAPASLTEASQSRSAPVLAPPTPEAGVLLASTQTLRPEATPKASKPADTQELRAVVLPAPLRISYEVKGEVKGFPYFANGELLWNHDGTSYAARLEISHFILGSRTQTSKGNITPQGLEPIRFGDKVRSEVAAHFERAKGKVSFSANAPDVPLQPGAQDQLSLFMQIAAMMSSEPSRFAVGTQIPFQAIGPRSSEQWVFKVGAYETLQVAGIAMRAVKLTRDANGEFDPRGEVWLAPELGYLPVRIRLIQANGDFVEQNMRSAQKP